MTAAQDCLRQERLAEAGELLKRFAHPLRLEILFRLLDGEMSVSDMERALGRRQANLSQHLAGLRWAGLVEARREGRAVLYSIADARAKVIVGEMHRLFCGGPERPALPARPLTGAAVFARITPRTPDNEGA